MATLTLRERAKQLEANRPKIEARIREACRDATMRAVEKAAEMTPTRPNELRGTNTQSGTMKQDWAAKSKTTVEVSGNTYTTQLNNDMEYASYVNDGHRMTRHFVPGLVINQDGVLEMNPDRKGGIVVGTKTSYVPGLHMVEAAREEYRRVLTSELEDIGEVFE